MKRLLLALGILLVGLIVLPPIWFAISPHTPPELPPPGDRVVLTNGLGVNVLDRGEGPPVVLVHGLPGTAYEWRVLQDELVARGHRVVAYDRVGYGRSDPRPEGAAHTVGANARELLELIQALDLRDVTLVGWSYGGATAMQASMTSPPRVARLVLVGTAGPDSDDAAPPEPPAFIRILYSGPVMAWRARVPPVANGLIAALSEQAYSGQPQPDWWIPGVQANFARPATVTTYRDEFFDLAKDGDLFDATAIDLPTLLLHGDDDRLAPVAIAEYLDTKIPDSTLRVTPGGSHMLPVTHAPALADAIAAFAAGSGSPDADAGAAAAR